MYASGDGQAAFGIYHCYKLASGVVFIFLQFAVDKARDYFAAWGVKIFQFGKSFPVLIKKSFAGKLSKLCILKLYGVPVYNLFGKLVFLVVYIFYCFSVRLSFYQPAKFVIVVIFVKNFAVFGCCYAAKAFAVIVIGIFCERFSLKFLRQPSKMVVFKFGNNPVL